MSDCNPEDNCPVCKGEITEDELYEMFFAIGESYNRKATWSFRIKPELLAQLQAECDEKGGYMFPGGVIPEELAELLDLDLEKEKDVEWVEKSSPEDMQRVLVVDEKTGELVTAQFQGGRGFYNEVRRDWEDLVIRPWAALPTAPKNPK